MTREQQPNWETLLEDRQRTDPVPGLGYPQVVPEEEDVDKLGSSDWYENPVSKKSRSMSSTC